MEVDKDDLFDRVKSNIQEEIIAPLSTRKSISPTKTTRIFESTRVKEYVSSYESQPSLVSLDKSASKKKKRERLTIIQDYSQTYSDNAISNHIGCVQINLFDDFLDSPAIPIQDC